MVVAISIGSCYDLKMNYSEAINFIKKLDVKGIELTFATPKELFGFNFNEEQIEYINSLDFKSIHMPFHEIEYSNNKEAKMVIEKGSELAEKIQVDYLLYHPNTIEDYSIFDYGFLNCIENLHPSQRYSGFKEVKEIKTLLDNYPSLGFVFDTCHAFQSGINPKDFLVLKDKIKGLHLSVQWRDGERLRTHGFLQENLEQFESIKPFLGLDVAKVIESDFYPRKVEMIEKEIELISNYST